MFFFRNRQNPVYPPAGLLAASPDIRAGNWRDGFPRVYHALDALLTSGEGQEKAGAWGGSKVDGVGVGCTIVTALLDRKRRQVSMKPEACVFGRFSVELLNPRGAAVCGWCA